MNVEYKETEIFELFPKILYSPLQRKRVLTFHGYFRNARKMIRYASRFDSPDKVCLVYLVGEIKPELINKMLAESGCSDRVCVITAQFPKEAMEAWERYDKLRKQLICIGAWDKEKDIPSQSYLADRKKLRDYYASFLDGGAEGQTVLFGVAEDYADCQRAVSALADEVQRNGAEILSAYDRYKLTNSSVPYYAASLLKADYSWTWNAEEYRRILFTTHKYGAWPWSNDIQNQARKEWAQQERGI